MQSEQPQPVWRIERFERSRHDRGSFDCGNTTLNEYLKTRASQDEKSSTAVLYVAVDASDESKLQRILGYYTLSAGSVLLTSLSEYDRKKLPRYPDVPVAHLGRMGVDISVQGKGLGKRLLLHCLYRIRSILREMACAGVEVYAKDERAEQFYVNYGFKRLNDVPGHLYLPISIVKSLPSEQ